MTKPSTRKQQADSHPTRQEFVIGDSSECSHSPSHRTYLGHQGPNAFYQCQECAKVVIGIPEHAHRQSTGTTSADRERR